LIVAFSIGLAAVLIAMGLAAVYAGNMIARLRLEGPLVQRWLPMASAAMIILLGLSVAMRGLVSAGIVQIRMWS
jgi:nickel/cobalt exporter